jgi:hypothetical protein
MTLRRAIRTVGNLFCYDLRKYFEEEPAGRSIFERPRGEVPLCGAGNEGRG